MICWDADEQKICYNSSRYSEYLKTFSMNMLFSMVAINENEQSEQEILS